MKHLGFLHKLRTCDCGKKMKEIGILIRNMKIGDDVIVSTNVIVKNGYFVGTFFHVTLKQIFQFSYFWSRKNLSVTEIKFQILMQNKNQTMDDGILSYCKNFLILFY